MLENPLQDTLSWNCQKLMLKKTLKGSQGGGEGWWKNITYKGTPIRLSADFFNRNSTGQERVKCHSQSTERETCPAKNTPSVKVTLPNEGEKQVQS